MSINNVYGANRHTKNDEYYQFGFEYFGSFLYGYTAWLRENIIKEKKDKIFFFSRDGFMMKKAYDVLDNENPLGIETQYVYFSRNSLRGALLWTCDNYSKSLQYLTKKKYILFSEISSYYGFNEEEGMKLAASVNLDWNENFIFSELTNNKKINKIYKNKRQYINNNSKEQYDLIVKYFKQIGLKGKCAIVDIGWHGSMQYYLEKLIEISGIEAGISGYYVGISPNVNLIGQTYGYLFCKDDLSLRRSLLCFLGVSEKIFQSLEGSTKGYAEIDKKIVPLMNTYEYIDDKGIQDYIQRLQIGAMEFVRLHQKDSININKLKDWAKPLINFGKYPSLKQVNLFRFFYNTDGSKVYFLPQKRLNQYTLREFIGALSNSCWKTGFMKATFKLPFPYYWIYGVLRK